MEFSKIEWTDHTFNPWVGCTRVSDGCKNCYAETLMDKRYHKVKWGPQGTRIKTSADYWKQPLKWNRQAQKENKRAKVFCASLADVFEKKPDQPEMNNWRRELILMMEQTPNLNWLLLTKRPENVTQMIQSCITIGVDTWFQGMGQRVWIGTSIENQEQASIRIPHLLNIPARIRFLSCEPLLGEVDLTDINIPNNARAMTIDCLRGKWGEFARPQADCAKINWVIVGGESGPNARPMHPNWARSIRDQCQAADVPFFFKQWGAWIPGMPVANDDGTMSDWVDWQTGFTKGFDFYGKHVKQLHDGTLVAGVGKKVAGRLLDLAEHNEFPDCV